MPAQGLQQPKPKFVAPKKPKKKDKKVKKGSNRLGDVLHFA
eukprot:CAMPEP_0113538388 /NCGR_PEP_ID=MMETSP0015_2-20120614/7336_1 /TAXON_ID=2838 /ORGANISM="Odontella" /LENGTH=40 /DNA_ID=CAMNT_0000437953 /DNA_START=428 /DNA_END=550 /DNA_ORIENTATION=+ /assembly_acc=CAM_ASM_000160